MELGSQEEDIYQAYKRDVLKNDDEIRGSFMVQD